jgi:3-deoxy-D-manno-octulosonic-acid transferase
LVIFVKYEFWFYYLKKIKYRGIPLLLISAIFRTDMSFFKWYGKLQRKMLSRFDHLFVQTHESKRLIDDLGLSTICSYAGDTRFDRVTEIAATSENIQAVENFIGNNQAIIAGSTWPEDEEVLEKAFGMLNNNNLKLIIAPHETDEKHIEKLKELFPQNVLYSELDTRKDTDSKVLIINNIGLLSRLYKYATITYIGGGLKLNGIHNVLEAAVFYKPVLFGPYYHKYSEAVELVKSGGGLSFSHEKRNGVMLKELVEGLLINLDEYKERCKAAGEFVKSHTGATEKIVHYIQEKRLLTN